MMPVVCSRFVIAYPNVRLEVTTEDRAVDMIEEGYDLVIRVNPAPDESLFGRTFLRDRLVVVASPMMARPSAGEAAPGVVRGSTDQGGPWSVMTPIGSTSISVDPVLRLSSLIMVRDAVRMGVGAARLPISMVSHYIAAGTLTQWGEVEGSDIALWALYPSRRLLSARVSAFLEFLRQSFPEGTPDELAAFVGS